MNTQTVALVQTAITAIGGRKFEVTDIQGREDLYNAAIEYIDSLVRPISFDYLAQMKDTVDQNRAARKRWLLSDGQAKGILNCVKAAIGRGELGRVPQPIGPAVLHRTRPLTAPQSMPAPVVDLFSDLDDDLLDDLGLPSAPAPAVTTPTSNPTPVCVSGWDKTGLDPKVARFALVPGIYTVVDPAGTSRTFKLAQFRGFGDDAGTLDTDDLVAMYLSGSDNETDYDGFAFVKPTGQVCVWSKFKANPRASIIVRLLTALVAKTAGYEIHASTYCYCCGRRLTTEASIKAGIGPICASKS